MKIRGNVVTGIFVNDPNNKDVEYTIGDMLFFNNILYENIQDSSILPDTDLELKYWRLIDPSVATGAELLSNTVGGKYASVNSVYDALFGENGIARFLTDYGTIKSWGQNLSEINITSTYAINMAATNISDLPPQYNVEGIAIVVTYVGNGIHYQEVTSFNPGGTVNTFSVRLNRGSWNGLFQQTTQSSLLQQHLTVLDRFRRVLKYLEDTKEKYTILIDSNLTSYTFTDQDTRPNANYKIQVKYNITSQGITEEIRKWYDIFRIDIDDSKSLVINLDLVDTGSTNAKVVLSNNIITCTNCVITKIIKYVGDDSESADGTDYFRFEFST